MACRVTAGLRDNRARRGATYSRTSFGYMMPPAKLTPGAGRRPPVRHGFRSGYAARSRQREQCSARAGRASEERAPRPRATPCRCGCKDMALTAGRKKVRGGGLSDMLLRLRQAAGGGWLRRSLDVTVI